MPPTQPLLRIENASNPHLQLTVCFLRNKQGLVLSAVCNGIALDVSTNKHFIQYDLTLANDIT